jgi:hypothetical protein
MTIGDGEPFVTWPMQSPTSSLGINVRFYSIDEGEDVDARYRVDLGSHTEAMLERMYDEHQLAVKGISTKVFEETTRGLFQQRLAFINAYGVATTLYVAFTTDPVEMKRLTEREQQVLASQKRRLPFMTYPKYQNRPTTLWGRVRWFVGHLRARYLHM